MSVLDRAAGRAEAASERLAAEDGVKAKLADELAEDAEFLRKLKPSLMVKRAKGEAPTDEQPTEAHRPRRAAKPSAPPKKHGGGPSPFLVVGMAVFAGIVLAKWLDWRGHAHPRW